MSNRSVFARTVRLSSWIGDAVLTLLAVWLAIYNRDHLTVPVALALGLCVVLGGMLPLAAYFIDYLHAKNERLAQEARAPDALRQVLLRFEKLVRRVEDTAEGSAKATLVARQVPDRIEEKFARLTAIAETLKPEAWASLAGGLEQLTQRLDEANQASGAQPRPDPEVTEDRAILRALNEQVRAWAAAPFAGREDLDRLVSDIRSLREEWSELRQTVETESLIRDEKLDTLLEQLSDEAALDEEWADDPLEEEVAVALAPDVGMESPPHPAVSEPAGTAGEDPESEEVLEDDWVEEPIGASDEFLPAGMAAEEFADESVEEIEDAESAADAGGDAVGGLAALAVDPPSADADAREKANPHPVGDRSIETDDRGPEDAGAGEAANPPSKGKKQAKPALERAAARSQRTATTAAGEMHLFAPEEIQTAPLLESIDNDAGLLLVKAFVGISNRIYARGDAPLSWEKGTPLRPSGIGEWRLELSDVTDPVQVELRVNDAVAALGSPITLNPGEPQSAAPRFPHT